MLKIKNPLTQEERNKRLALTKRYNRGELTLNEYLILRGKEPVSDSERGNKTIRGVRRDTQDTQ